MLLLLIGEVINKLKNTKYFNKLDLIQGYNNIWIKEEDEQKDVFLINKRLFEPKVIYFELYNLPGTFQRIMNSIFRKLLYKEVLVNYIDNFVILAKIRKELKIAKKYNLCFKQSKYDFNIKKISILGVIVGQEEIQMENNKIKVVKKWKTLTKIKKSGKFFRVCRLLLVIHQELQLYSKTFQ